MKIEKALKLRERAKNNYRDIFSSARHFGHSHTVMLEKRASVLDGLSKAPYWVKAYLEGYWQALQDQAYADALIYGAIINGQFYSTHHDRPDYYEVHGIEPSAFASDNPTKGHYWTNSLKPFFVD